MLSLSANKFYSTLTLQLDISFDHRIILFLYQINKRTGFPDGSEVKNLPINAGDRGSVPGPGRSQHATGHLGRGPPTLSLCSGAGEPQLLRPGHPGARAPQGGKPLDGEARTPHLERGPTPAETREKSEQQRRPSTATDK